MSANLDELLAATPPDQLAEIIAELPPSVADALVNDPALQAATETTPDTLVGLGHQLIPGFRVRPHIDYLADRITKATKKVEAGESQYLIVEMPPRAGKSTVATQLTPAWLLSQHPEWPIALVSHDGGLAATWGRQIRRWTETGQLGPQTRVAPDAGAVREWQTTAGGSVRSISTRESFIGRGAKVLIIDDPHKDFADAHSATKRDEVWDWWKSVAFSRLHFPVLVIVIQTRWHEDDLVGRLLDPEYEGKHDLWDEILLPAIAGPDDPIGREIGEPLISPLIDETAAQAKERWAETETVVGSYVWAAMYQQRPSPPDGRIINRDWIQYYDHPPTTFDQTIQSWDLAFDKSENSSYVVGQVWGKRGADLYLLDQYRDRTDFVGTIAAVEQMTAKWPDATLKLVEKQANGAAVLSALKNKVPGLRPINPAGTKLQRLQAVTPLLEAGNVHLPSSAAWIRDFVEELAAFPSAAHDDQVDAMTQALQRLGFAQQRRKPRVKVG